MEVTIADMIRVLRDTSERLWFGYPEHFRRPDHHINIPALRQFLCGMWLLRYGDMPQRDEAIADYFVALDQHAKAAILDDTFRIYWAAEN